MNIQNTAAQRVSFAEAARQISSIQAHNSGFVIWPWTRKGSESGVRLSPDLHRDQVKKHRFHVEAHGDVWDEIADYAKARIERLNIGASKLAEQFGLNISPPAMIFGDEHTRYISITPPTAEGHFGKKELRIIATSNYAPDEKTNGRAKISYVVALPSVNPGEAPPKPFAVTLRGVGHYQGKIVDKKNRIVNVAAGEDAAELVRRTKVIIDNFTPSEKPLRRLRPTVASQPSDAQIIASLWGPQS